MQYAVATVDQLSVHLKALRKARGLTQAQLGELLGVKQVRIAEIEADPGSVSVSQMHKLLSALGVQLTLRETNAGWAPVRPAAKVAASAGPAAPALPRARKPTGGW